MVKMGRPANPICPICVKEIKDAKEAGLPEDEIRKGPNLREKPGWPCVEHRRAKMRHYVGDWQKRSRAKLRIIRCLKDIPTLVNAGALEPAWRLATEVNASWSVLNDKDVEWVEGELAALGEVQGAGATRMERGWAGKNMVLSYRFIRDYFKDASPPVLMVEGGKVVGVRRDEELEEKSA
jgi:hypothetical protein